MKKPLMERVQVRAKARAHEVARKEVGFSGLTMAQKSEWMKARQAEKEEQQKENKRDERAKQLYVKQGSNQKSKGNK